MASDRTSDLPFCLEYQCQPPAACESLVDTGEGRLILHWYLNHGIIPRPTEQGGSKQSIVNSRPTYSDATCIGIKLLVTPTCRST